MGDESSETFDGPASVTEAELLEAVVPLTLLLTEASTFELAFGASWTTVTTWLWVVLGAFRVCPWAEGSAGFAVVSPPIAVVVLGELGAIGGSMANGLF